MNSPRPGFLIVILVLVSSAAHAQEKPILGLGTIMWGGVGLDPAKSGGAIMGFTAVYMQVPEGYIAFVEELPGANTQGDTLEEARENLREAVTLVLEANRELAEKSLAGRPVTREPFELVNRSMYSPDSVRIRSLGRRPHLET